MGDDNLNAKQFGHLPAVADLIADDPIILVDVGSRGGLPLAWRDMSSQLKVIGFEPDTRSYNDLVNTAQEEADSTQINSALHREEGEVMLNLTRDPGDSSLYPPNKLFLRRFPESERFDVIQTVPVQATTLDMALESHSIKRVDFIKLDTQGSELDILNGANDLLSKGIFGLEIEVEFNEMYQGQPLFGAVDEFLRPFGYELFDIAPTYWKQRRGDPLKGDKGQIIFADALFFLAPSIVAAHLGGSTNDSVAHILRSMQICLVYGYVDYALTISDIGREDLGQKLHESIISEIVRSATIKDNYKWIRGRGRAVKFLKTMENKLRAPNKSWRRHGSDGYLGNRPTN